MIKLEVSKGKIFKFLLYLSPLMLAWIEIGLPVALYPYLKQGFMKALPSIIFGYLPYMIYVILLLIHFKKHATETILSPESKLYSNVAKVVTCVATIALLHSGVMIYQRFDMGNLIKSECYRVPNTNPMCPGFNSYNTEPDLVENLL